MGNDEIMLHPGRLIRRSAVVLMAASLTGCANPNTVANREEVSARIPTPIKQFAFGIQSPLSELHLVEDKPTRVGLELHNVGTAQLLPNGTFLTASHVLSDQAQVGKSVLVLLDGDYVIAEVLARRSGRENGDWAILRPRLWTDVAGTEPRRLQHRLTDPMRRRVRYQGDAKIPAGTTLYAFGYIFAAELVQDDVVPISATIIPGTAPADLVPPGELRMNIDVPLDVHGMSGGPFGYYEAETDTLVIVGMLKGGLRMRQLFGEAPPFQLEAQRLTPEMLGTP